MQKVILLLAANPEAATRLRLDAEQNRIRRAHRGSKLRDHFRIEHVLSASQKDIRQALLDHRPYLVHFSGHGTRDAEIVIVKDDGSPHLVGREALGPFFEIFSDRVRCVVLNSCYSGALAERISRDVGCVVGMKDAVKDEVALEYAVAFYDALFAGEDIEKAHQLGCNAIRWADLPGHLVPMLHLTEGLLERPILETTVNNSSPRVSQAKVWSELTRLYARPSAAQALLSNIDFPRQRIPAFNTGNAVEFWTEVRELLDDGVVEESGFESLIQEALSAFPGNKVLKQALSKARCPEPISRHPVQS